MKKIIAFVLILTLCFVNLFAMKKANNKKDLIIFAAASMTESLNELKSIYEKKNKDINLVYNFDSSGTLKTQILQGAVCDVFLSAALKQMNELEDKDFIDRNTRINLLENKTVIAVKKGNESKVADFEDLINKLKSKKIVASIGNSDVPVGQYTKKIFNYYGFNENDAQTQLSYGSNVKEVVTQIKEGSVDCGIVYSTDAVSANLVCVAVASEKETGGKVVYPVAVLKSSVNQGDAVKFLDFLKSFEAMAVFEKIGFSKAE